MDISSPEALLSQGLLGKIEPLVQTIESQLKDLEQGQALILNNVATLSHDLALSEAQLNQVVDIFAQLPHYVAKVNAMKTTMSNLHTLNKKIKRRAELVCSGRERQAVREQETRAREQAFDRVIAAVEAPTTSDNRSSPTSTGSSSGGLGGNNSHMAGGASAAGAGVGAPGLPFPLPAKPAFPIVSKRSPNSSGAASPAPPSSLREGSPAASPSPRSSRSSTPVPTLESPTVVSSSLSRTTLFHTAATSTTSGRPRRPDSAASMTSLLTSGGGNGGGPSSIPTTPSSFVPTRSGHHATPSISSSYSSSSYFSTSQVGIDRFPELSIGADGDGGPGAVEVVRKKKKQQQPKKKKSHSSVVSLDKTALESKTEQNES
ncbi:hypothetical protein BGZ73_007527 [Actinomortierella ambigua]|nr:hypothetical protein BGZ73_007527 [Actinomortierella ambigua]